MSWKFLVTVAVAVRAIGAMIGCQIATPAEENTTTQEFRNGVIVGQAFEASKSAMLFMELISDMDEEGCKLPGRDKDSIRQRLFGQLLHNAGNIRRAVELPALVLPDKSHFRSRLEAIADFLYSNAPAIMNEDRYNLSVEEIRDLFGGAHVDDRTIRQSQILQEENRATIRVLSRYRSKVEQQKSPKADEGRGKAGGK